MNLEDLKKDNEAPEWLDDAAYSTLQAGYLLKSETPKMMYQRISKAAASYYKDSKKWEQKFFEAMWSNWLCCSSPILANLGTKRGMPISCFSIDVGDSVDNIFTKNHELAILSKSGGGVGISLGRIRGRGKDIDGNGKSEGIVPWAKIYDTTIASVSQGSTRRGAAVVYLPIDHLDIEEFLNIRRPVGDLNRRCLNLNHGSCVSDDWMHQMLGGNKSKQNIWKSLLQNRVETGEPYLFFTDNVNRQNPECYKANNLIVTTSNLCNEIYLFTDKDHTFVCCLSSLNLVRYDEWKDTDLVEISIRFLDAVLQEYIVKSEGVPGLEASRRSAIKGRALGLGVLGWHTLLQEKGLPFDSFESMRLNNEIFKLMRERAEAETARLAEELGEPEWCKGFNRRNTHLCVDPKTTLLTKEGYREIKSLSDQEIEIWNGHEWSMVRPFKTSDDSEMLKFTLSDGSTLNTTYYHKWLIKNNRFAKAKEAEAKDLKVGDKLDKWENPIIEGKEEFPYAYTHGFFCGDGSTNQSKPQYENCHRRKEVRVYGDKMNCLEKLAVKSGCSVRPYKNKSSKEAVRFYIPDEMADKFVVPSIRHTVKSRLQWLAGLWDADGDKCGISSARVEFLQEIKQMLGYTGILAKVVKYDRSEGGYGNDCGFYYKLLIPYQSLTKMVEFGFEPQRVKLYKSKINKQQYIQIVSIEKVENSETYCLTELKRGTALFNGIKTKQCAVAPTVSNSTISGGVSPGIEPIAANIFSQKSAKGTFIRKNRTLEKLLEAKGKNTSETWKSINEFAGSVQHLKFLSDEEKEVFLTAREINQHAIINQAVQRQRWIDQGQSVNLFFAANSDPQYIHDVHIAAWTGGLKGLYYMRSEGVLRGDLASRSKEECEACGG